MVAPPGRGAAVMDLELHQIDRRYESLRRSSSEREKRVLASLARVGQQLPIIVVSGEEPDRYVLVDGYKRVRCLIKLREDTIRATCWALSEPDALVLERLMRTRSDDSPLEQGWLLSELRDRFDLSIEDLARRFDRSASWVSGRLALVAQLPEPIQAQVRRGEIAAHAAIRFLVPVYRAHPDECLRLAQAIGPLRPTTRQTEALCSALMSASAETRERLLDDPALFLRARETVRTSPMEKDPVALLLDDLGALGGVARRAYRRVRDGILGRMTPPERDELDRCLRQAKADTEQLEHHQEA